ncbi:unnamed protein product [Caenorhabditis angaria]|uniref:Uncharacterized protein n=1 Tax=Caenorhabditis angaria TaxID=860376 RepID=A0A9P1IUH3_9PELO|nr:unnamed protein product [Caenorhabditis angaria]
MIRERRSVLYATFYEKYAQATKKQQDSIDPFNLDNIGDGYDAWTRSETQLLVLAVILIIVTLVFALIVAMDCTKNFQLWSFRDVIQRQPRRSRGRSRAQPNSGIVNLPMDDLKAPPINILAPPPYRN